MKAISLNNTHRIIVEPPEGKRIFKRTRLWFRARRYIKNAVLR